MVEGRAEREVLEVRRRGRTRVAASLAEEAAVRIAHNGTVVADLAASPVALDELAVGHLVLAGRVRGAGDVRSVEARKARGGHVVQVTGTAHPPKAPAPRLAAGPRLAPAQVLALMKGFLDGGESYREGGGVHTSALVTLEGEALFAADIGKVNTLDRLAGRALLGGADPFGMLLFTTGRLTGAMVARGLALGCPVLVSHSGPTTEGLALAERAGATLLGYVRGGAFRVYAGPARVRGAPGRASRARRQQGS